MPTPDWQVTFTEEGRSGYVHYRESGGRLSFYWEFGGGDVVTAISVGSADAWERDHPWAAARREEILQRVAAEVIRQRAPGCVADFDPSGWLNIRHPATGAPPARPAQAARATAAANHHAVSAAKARIVTYLAVGALLVAGALWMGRSALSVQTTGSAFGIAKRTPRTIVSMVSRLEPYVPSLNRSGDKDRHAIGLLLHDAVTGERRYIALQRQRTSPDMVKSRLDVVRGDYAWVLAPEPMRVHLRSGELTTTEAIARDPSLAAPNVARTMAELGGSERLALAHLAKGGIVAPGRWLGILEADDIPGAFREGFGANAAEHFERSQPPRRLHVATLRDGVRKPEFVTLQRTEVDSLYNGAFVRVAPDSGLLLLAGGDVLMLHYARQYRAGTVLASRVAPDGHIVWQRDTGIHEITDILPDPDRPALIGTRDPVPGRLPETILVVFDAQGGEARTHSLWMKE
jgi:hypothetical protein